MWKLSLAAIFAFHTTVDVFAWSALSKQSAVETAPWSRLPRPFSSNLRAAAEVESETSNQVGASNNLSRRAALSVAALSVGSGIWAFEGQQQKNSWFSISDDASTRPEVASNEITILSSLDEAMQLIESNVDKRFLHAVVASDYQSFYAKRPNGAPKNKSPFVGSLLAFEDASHVLTGSDRENLAHQLKDRPIQLVHSNLEAAKRLWGSDTISIWPLQGESDQTAHYVWPANEGNFANAAVSAANHVDDDANAVIVDGIDCGRMSLEDALQGNMQVLVQAERFLCIPASMEQPLRERLRGAFLI